MTYKGLINSKNIPHNGIFVFGSNPIGINGNPRKGTGGAALVAQIEFGVKSGEIMDNRLSDSGKAYGLVTVDAPRKYISKERIINNIKRLYEFAEENKDKLFFIAYDGINPDATSLNGKTRRTLGSLFYQGGDIPENIVFEENFMKLVVPNNLQKGFDI